MKRKLLLGSTVVSAMLASSAMAQVINFHDANNGYPIDIEAANYNELFAGQGAYADPGNDIWNGFGNNPGYGSTYFYSGGPGGAAPWPQQSGNPGNPYAAYYAASGCVTSTGNALFNANALSPSACGNATSSGHLSPVTLTVGGYLEDNGALPDTAVPNGSPSFLLGNAAVNNGSTPNEVLTLQNVPAGTYGLYLYGANFDNDRGTLFAVNSGNAHNGIASTLNSQAGSPAATFVEGQNFVIFENVTPDGSGNITITASPNPQDGVGNTNLSGETDVNGFQLIFNPPPTAQGMTSAQNVFAGGTANFSFSPAFASSPAFQWQSVIGGVTNNLADGGNISGSATTNLTIKNVAVGNVGLYQCILSTASATNTSPAAPLTILTSTAANILQPGDVLSDFGDNTNPPYNSIPPPFNMTVTKVEDNTLFQYENFGSNGSVAPFLGPVGFVVTPQTGASVVTGMRLFTSSSHPEDDPTNYLLEGSVDGTNFTTISRGLLALPAQRNAAGGIINATNQVLQELDFSNTTTYTTYRLTFTNVNNNALASNGLQIAEIQLLGIVPGNVPPVITFNGNGTNWTLNEGAIITPTISNNVLTLTDGGTNETASAFFDTPQNIDSFVASYTYQATGSNSLDNGITFCLQNSASGAKAVGAGGVDLGYAGITPSAAFEMNISPGASGGVGVQVGTDGSTPDSSNPTAPYITTAPVNIASGDPINVQLYYSQNVLEVWLEDTTTSDTFTASLSLSNLSGLVGNKTAYVGFTGASGGNGSAQTVSNFVFSATAPPVLSITRGTPGTVVISWPIDVASQFVLQQATALNGVWSDVNVTPQNVNSQNQVTLTPSGTTFYRLALP